MALAPIWKDRIVTLAAGADSADFEIRLNSDSGDLIYAGRAYRRPGAADVTARINDVCADYLDTLHPRSFAPAVLAVTFVTVVGGSAVDTVTFFDDWSYDPDFDPAADPLADPINGELDPRQTLYFGVLSGATINATVTLDDGTTSTETLTVTDGVASLDLSGFAGPVFVVIGGVNYTVRREDCARYAAVYLNAHGGWDSLLLDGYDTRRDSLTRHTSQTEYDNADPTARGRRDYAIEVTPGWTLRTRLLTDEQSARMHNLLNSPDIYLLDLSSGDCIPIVLTDAEYDRQSFRGNGRRPNQYTFNAQLAQERFRR